MRVRFDRDSHSGVPPACRDRPRVCPPLTRQDEICYAVGRPNWHGLGQTRGLSLHAGLPPELASVVYSPLAHRRLRPILKPNSRKIRFCVFLPWQKYILVCFLSFFHGRNTSWFVLCISSMAEIHFGLFCVFLPWQKYILVCFLSFFHGRNTFWFVLCLSSMAEIHIQLFYVNFPR